MLKQTIAAALAAMLLAPPVPVLAQKASTDEFRIKVNAEVVLVNVVVRDKDGKPVSGLKQSDFVLLEDTKPQSIASFDFENIESAALPAQIQSGPAQRVLDVRTPNAQKPPVDDALLRDRRLIVLFFDETGMETDEVERSAKTAERYVDMQMSPADLVAIVTFNSAMK